jgi:alkylation response protein AidB-like acyl-CoA dehydrogenase
VTGIEGDRDTEQAVVQAATGVFWDRDKRNHLESLGESGFLGVGIAESHGGTGGSHRQAGLIAEVAGRARGVVPYLHQVLGAHAAAGIGDQDLVRALVYGTRSAVVFFEGEGQLISSPLTGNDGQIILVRADSVVVLDQLGSSLVHRRDAWLSPDWSDITLTVEGLPAPRQESAAPKSLPFGLANGLVAMAINGVVAQLLDDTASYVRDRHQFGVPVGSFQGVKHPLAALFIEIIHARSLALGALEALDGGQDGADRLLAMAKVAANGVAERSQSCVQAMGGIGFTWEAETHRYLKLALRLRHWPQPHLALRRSLRTEKPPLFAQGWPGR